MIYHFCGTSPYITKYIDFLKSNRQSFNLNNHHFIINDTNTFQIDQATLQDIKYSLVNSKWGFISLLNKIKKNDTLIIHGLFNPRLLIYFYLFNRRLVERCIWSIWGGDVYFYRLKNDSCKNRIIEYLRSRVIPKFPKITCLVRGDYEIVREVYGTNARYICSFYPNPVDFKLIESVSDNKRANHKRFVMIGNSGDPSNNHIDAFDKLEKFKHENIQIICPLSYGDSSYIQETVAYGKKVFGDKFLPLTQFLAPTEYINLLAGIDVAIMNHDRQQALSNILLLLALNKKVYLNGNTTHYKFFIDNGVLVYNADLIANASYGHFISLSDTSLKNNATIVKNIFSEHAFISMWKDVFQE